MSDSQIQVLAKDAKAPQYTEGTQSTEQETAQEVVSDPTIAHATAGEIAAEAAPLSNGPTEEHSNGLSNANVADDAANAVAESHWDTTANNELSMSQEWVDVKVPRDPGETDTGLTATPAVPSNTQSWADDHPEPATEVR